MGSSGAVDHSRHLGESILRNSKFIWGKERHSSIIHDWKRSRQHHNVLWPSKDQTSHRGNLIAHVHEETFLFVEAEVCQDLFSPAFMDTAGAFSPLLAFTAFLSSSLFVIYLSGLRDRCSSACMRFEGGCSICSSVCLPHSLPNLLAGHSISKSFKHKQEAINLQQPEYSMRFLDA